MNRLKYLKLFESVVDEEDIQNIFIDISDIGASISIDEGWTNVKFLPDLNTYIQGDEYEEEDEEQYDGRVNSSTIFIHPRKGMTRTYKININAKRCNSEQILNIFEELKIATDRLSEIGQSWINYTLINNNLTSNVWLKTKELATTDIRDKVKKYISNIGIKFIELEGPRGPNSPDNISLDFDSGLSKDEIEVIKSYNSNVYYTKKEGSSPVNKEKQKIISKKVNDFCNELKIKISKKLDITPNVIRLRPHTNLERIELGLFDHIY